MTNSSDPVGVDYARAVAEAAAFLARRDDGREPASLGRWARWAALPPSADLRYPMPELDPARR